MVGNGQDGNEVELENFWQVTSRFCSYVSDELGENRL